MRRRLAIIVTSIAVLSPASPAHAAFFAGEAIDGPSADIGSVGDLDLARDGTGAVAYVRRDGGIDHIYVSRLVNGAYQPPERVDTGLETPSSQPAIAASDGGRVAVAFVSGGTEFVALRPDAASTWTPPQAFGPGASNPSIDMSINGAAYMTWTANGDVLAAHLERGTTTFSGLAAPLDINPVANAGSGTARSKVAISADGTAVAVWGEAGHVYARRLYNDTISTLPVDVSLPSLDGHAAGAADLPSVDIEDDSSFAWIAFRQFFDDGGIPKGRAIGRRLRGSRLEDPVAYDGLGWGGQGVDTVAVDINGKGAGIMTAGTTGGTALSAMIKDDILNPALPIGGSAPPAQPSGAVAETLTRVVGWLSPADGTVRGAFYNDRADAHGVPAPGPDTVLSTPDFGPVDQSAGFDVAGDRTGDVSLVFVQGAGDQRRLVAASYARTPGSIRLYTPATRWRNPVLTPLSWSSSLDLWGVTYNVLVDNKVILTTQDTKATLPAGAVRDGLHRWRVIATDRHGQTVSASTRTLKVDTRPPKVSFSIKRSGRVATVSAKASDGPPRSRRASGLSAVRIDFGDRSGAVKARKATHGYGRTGMFTVRVTAVDAAGNTTAVERRLRVG
jgi:hypothetical protein